MLHLQTKIVAYTRVTGILGLIEIGFTLYFFKDVYAWSIQDG